MKFDALKDELLKRDDVRTEYEALAEEPSSAEALIRARSEADMNRHAMLTLKSRAARGNPQAALAILARAPDVPPDPGDEIVREAPAARPRP